MLPLLDLAMPSSYPLNATTAVVFALFLILNYVVNIVLGWFLLRLANFDFAAGRGRFLKLFTISTLLFFAFELVIGFLWPYNYAIAGVLLFAVYAGIFSKLGLSSKRALAYGLIFAILTNPLVGDIALGGTGSSQQTFPAELALRSMVPTIYYKMNGVGIETQENLGFYFAILRPDVLENSGRVITPDNIEFICAQSEFCAASNAPLIVTADQIGPTKTTISGAAAVCSGDGQHYYVCIAKSKNTAAEVCKTKCGFYCSDNSCIPATPTPFVPSTCLQTCKQKGYSTGKCGVAPMGQQGAYSMVDARFTTYCSQSEDCICTT